MSKRIAILRIPSMVRRTHINNMQVTWVHQSQNFISKCNHFDFVFLHVNMLD